MARKKYIRRRIVKLPSVHEKFCAPLATDSLDDILAAEQKRYKYVRFGITTDLKAEYDLRKQRDEIQWSSMKVYYSTPYSLEAEYFYVHTRDNENYITNNKLHFPLDLFDEYEQFYVYVMVGRRRKAMKKTTYNVLDLFCGCGGISEGYRLAGFDIVGGIDFNEYATVTFKHNFKKAKVHNIDITTFKDEDIDEEYGDVDVIVGGPPCQGFSTANRHQKEMEDPRNKLFFEYIRFVQRIRPKVIMIENVRGLLTRDNCYAINRIEEILGEEDYNISYKVLDASEYGVPQNRKRAIIVGIRKDFQDVYFDFNTIRKSPKTIVDDAIGELYGFEQAENGPKELKSKANSALRKYFRRKDNLIFDHDIVYPAEKVQKRISFVPQGGNWQDVPTELWPTDRNNRHSSAYKRLDPKTQSCTIDTGNAHSNYFHPLYNRIPTVRESARLQSFPDSFEFQGPRGSKYRQVGNAVPPLLAKAVAEAIKKILDNENN